MATDSHKAIEKKIILLNFQWNVSSNALEFNFMSIVFFLLFVRRFFTKLLNKIALINKVLMRDTFILSTTRRTILKVFSTLKSHF